MKSIFLILFLFVAVISAKAFADITLCENIENQISDANVTLNAWGEKKTQLESWYSDAGCVINTEINTEEVTENAWINSDIVTDDNINW